MPAILAYPACLIVFAVLVWALQLMTEKRRAGWQIVTVGGIFGALSFAIQYLPLPRWLMADFRKAYYPAGEAVLEGPEALLSLMTDGVHGFVNLPVIAFLFAPFGALPLQWANFLFLVLGLAMCVLAWRVLATRASLDPASSAIALFLLIGSGPSAYSVVVGNTSQMVFILIVIGTFAFARRAEKLAGIALACAAMIKPPLLLTGVFAVLRGRWGVAVAGGLTCLMLTVLSVLIFGVELHRVWLFEIILPAAGGILSAHNVQSIGGVITRFFVGGAHIGNWNPHPIPEWVSLVILSGQIIVGGVIVAALLSLARKAQGSDTKPMEISLIILAIVLLPNLVWSHYLIWLLLPVAILLRNVFPLQRGDVVSHVTLVAAALIAQPVLLWKSESYWMGEVFARVVVSLPFAGSILILGLCAAYAFGWRRPGTGFPG